MLSDFDWVLAQLQSKLDWTKDMDPKWVRDWLLWCDQRRFVYMLKDRQGYMIMRPVHSQLGQYMARDYWGTLLWHHLNGDTIWIDSGWAPGHWPDVIKLLKATGRRYMGWSHVGRVYLMPVTEVSGDKPILSQLRRWSIHQQRNGQQSDEWQSSSQNGNLRLTGHLLSLQAT